MGLQVVDELLSLAVSNKILMSKQILVQISASRSYGLENVVTLRLICLTMLVTFSVWGAQAASWEELLGHFEAQVGTTSNHAQMMHDQRAL